MSLDAMNESYPADTLITISDADGTAPKGILNSGLPPVRVDAIILTNNDTAAHVFVLTLNFGGDSPSLGSVNIPAGAGWSATPAVEFFRDALSGAINGLCIPAGGALVGQVTVAMGAGKVLGVACLGGLL